MHAIEPIDPIHAFGLLAALGYVVVRRRRRGSSHSSAAIVMFAVLLGYTTLLRPDLYLYAGDRIVAASEWPDALHALDEEIREIREMPAETLSDLLEPLGWGSDPEPDPPPPIRPGQIEATLVPYGVALVATALRALAFVSSVMLLGIGWLMGIVSRRGGERAGLVARVEAPEATLDAKRPA